jgi:hypothetical protein
LFRGVCYTFLLASKEIAIAFLLLNHLQKRGMLITYEAEKLVSLNTYLPLLLTLTLVRIFTPTPHSQTQSLIPLRERNFHPYATTLNW